MPSTIAMMTRVLLVAGVIPSSHAGPAQETAVQFRYGESGDALFKTYCGSCHGKTAKGDGPLADVLRNRPPDLTLLARRNRGTFEADKVHRMIDGREPVKGHGGSDMPVWGDAFKRSGQGQGEEEVKVRIGEIVEFLRSIQAK